MRKKLPFIIFALIFIAFVAMEYFGPKEIDWRLSFSKNHKIPYGSYALYDLLEDTYSDSELKIQSRSLFQFFNENYNLQYTSMIFLSFNINMSDNDASELLSYVSNGNNAFIVTSNFPNILSDTLNFEVTYNPWSFTSNNDSDTSYLNLVNPKLNNNENYLYDKGLYPYYFSKIDTANTIILGQGNDSLINFVQIPFGEGMFYLNTQPFAFTNYNILKRNNHEYAFKALSYLPSQTIYWDEYFKPNKANNNSQLRYILSNEALNAAYVLLIIGLVLFILFHGKRKQRIVQVLKKLENTSLEFIYTISRLYYHSKNHKDIAEKKYLYLLDFLRTKYYIKIKRYDFNSQKIAEKTGVSEKTVSMVFKQAQLINSYQSISQDQLMNFNKAIEQFYDECM